MITFSYNGLRLVVEDDTHTGNLAILDFLSDWADYRTVPLSATGPEASASLWTEQGLAACAVLAGIEFEADWMMVPEGAADGPVGGEVAKHYGPGPHDSGSSQSVHGRGGSKLTLYRGEGSHDHPSYYPSSGPNARAGMWWTDDPDSARQYAAGVPGGKVYTIEVDESEAEREGLYFLIPDPDVRSRRQELDEPDTDYRGSHQPTADYGAPAHDLTKLVSEDIYEHPEWYPGSDYPEVVEMIRSVRNKPDAKVTIYRAVPEDVEEINPGDWVTPSREYARQHGESNLYDTTRMRGVYNIISREVTAKELVWPGDYLPEWGWFPDNELGKRMLKMRSEAAEFAKHYGPGPHPGTGTPQSIHAPASTLDPDASTLDDTVVEGNHSTMTISGDRSPGMDEIISNAFLHFDDKFPGLLPPDVRAVVLPPDEVPFEAGEAAAWVHMSEPTLWVNPHQVGTAAAMNIFQDRAHDSHMAIFKLMSALEDQLTPMKLANTLYEGVVFHELAHIATQNMDRDLWQELPYYSAAWYPEQVAPGDPSLPSDYAAMTGDANEFFAEAVMDWAYSPEPAPLSTLTAELLRERLND